MNVYMIDFNPCWGTRWQEVDRHMLGPFSTEKRAMKIHQQIIDQMKWPKDTPRLTVICKKIDEALSFRVSSNLGKEIKIVP